VFPQSDSAVLKEFKSLNGMKQLANPAMHIIKIDDPGTGQTVGYDWWLISEILRVPPHTLCLERERNPSSSRCRQSIAPRASPHERGTFLRTSKASTTCMSETHGRSRYWYPS
jgi:hypothetical protein